MNVTGAEGGRVPGVAMLSGGVLLTSIEHDESEYTLYMTVPAAVEASPPVTVALSVTGVPGGTEIEDPDAPLPDKDVATDVANTPTVTVSA